ncbi:mucin, partial [Thraustotheca clavata]
SATPTTIGPAPTPVSPNPTSIIPEPSKTPSSSTIDPSPTSNAPLPTQTSSTSSSIPTGVPSTAPIPVVTTEFPNTIAPVPTSQIPPPTTVPAIPPTEPPQTNTPPPQPPTNTPPPPPPATQTPVPTMIPIIFTNPPQVTVDPKVQFLIQASPTPPAATTTNIDSILLLSTPAPSVTTGNPLEVNQETAPPNDHSENINRGQISPDTIADLKAKATIGTETTAEATVRYIISSLIGITAASLAFFQFLAINPSFIPPDATMERAFAPNTWELPTFVAFIQSVSLLSIVHSTNTPQLFYMNFLDSLSWLNFLIRAKAPDTTASVTSVQLIGNQRRLTTDSWYDGSGYVNFSLRSNVLETDWFFRLWIAILIVVAVLLVVVIITGVAAKWLTKRGNPFHSDSNDSQRRSVTLRSISKRLLGMCVMVVFFSYLPLSLISMCEILRDSTSTGFPHTNAILSMLTFLILALFLVAAAISIHSKSEAGLSRWQTRVVWGVVYCSYYYTHRLFFLITAVVQVLSGVFVASITIDNIGPLVALIILHIVYVLTIVVMGPYQCQIQLWFTLITELMLIVIYGVACALMKHGINIGSQTTLSYVIIILVCVVVLFMFLRQLLVLWNYASGWAKQEDNDYSGVPTAYENEYESSGANYSISLHGTDTLPRTRSRNDDTIDNIDAYYNMPSTIRLMPTSERRPNDVDL